MIHFCDSSDISNWKPCNRSRSLSIPFSIRSLAFPIRSFQTWKVPVESANTQVQLIAKILVNVFQIFLEIVYAIAGEYEDLKQSGNDSTEFIRNPLILSLYATTIRKKTLFYTNVNWIFHF